MQVNASARLTASSTQHRLFEFVSALGPDEQEFFYLKLPKLIDRWFDWLEKNSDHLSMQFASSSAKYRHVDALAVALGHLRPIYTPEPPNFVYRSLLVDGEAELPTKDVANFKSDRKWSALQSWTYNRDPVVEDRNIKQKSPVELVLRIPGSQVRKHVLTDYLQLVRLGRDAIALCTSLKKFPKQMAAADVNAVAKAQVWTGMLAQISDYSHEKEVLMYVPSGVVLNCGWRAYALDRHGRRVKTIKD